MLSEIQYISFVFPTQHITGHPIFITSVSLLFSTLFFSSYFSLLFSSLLFSSLFFSFHFFSSLLCRTHRGYLMTVFVSPSLIFGIRQSKWKQGVCRRAWRTQRKGMYYEKGDILKIKIMHSKWKIQGKIHLLGWKVT